MFKKGDLFTLNERGIKLFQYITGSVGVIISPGKLMYEYDFEEKAKYFVYDILISGQLFTDIPEEFINRMIQNDENNIK